MRQMTDPADRFLLPASPRQRRYEALRARFVDGCSAAEAASRFGYAPGSFRNLCSQFLRSEDPDFLFPSGQTAAAAASPADDSTARARQRILALRQDGLSVHDISARLRQEDLPHSVGFVHKALRQAGLPKLARRSPEQQPAVLQAPLADRRALDLAPRRLRTAFGGLFLFAADLARLDLDRLATELPGSQLIPAGCALRALLALKLWGIGRPSRIMPAVLDEGSALFAGLNAMPKRSSLTEYSCRCDPRLLDPFTQRWHDSLSILDSALGAGRSFDLDFHAIPYHGDDALVEKHYVSKRSRRQKAILCFLARDADARTFAWASARPSKATHNDQVLSFVDAWKERTGSLPAELVFDSRLTTYANLARLQDRGIAFLTLRRRSAKMVEQLLGLPRERWHTVRLSNVGRRYRTPRILDQTVCIKDYPQPIRQIAVRDLGHDKPTLLLTNQLDAPARELIDRYARRMLIENTIADAVNFFHMDALSAAVPLRIDLDVQLTLMASALYRLLANRLGDRFRTAEPASLFRKFVEASATVDISEQRIEVTLGRRAHNPHLIQAGYADTTTSIPWLDNRPLKITFA